ncbi:unnamed protein product [Protopolystoma xenopodis]|uniref:TRAF-type domain-containing protein n=1 Tax=Protopolystoma xenopodis TaxID=117903 RepID=A0A448WBG8_9PLAT|nr:unnamed protein product [Protopolystoma xenopodis]
MSHFLIKIIHFLDSLLDKLLVVCPNTEHCSEVVNRCDLESHLSVWCRGAALPCANTNSGCCFPASRALQPQDRKNCVFSSPDHFSPVTDSSNMESSPPASLVATKTLGIRTTNATSQNFVSLGANISDMNTKGDESPCSSSLLSNILPVTTSSHDRSSDAADRQLMSITTTETTHILNSPASKPITVIYSNAAVCSSSSGELTAAPATNDQSKSLKDNFLYLNYK